MSTYNNNHYTDIRHMSRPVSKYPQPTRQQRAAQFAAVTMVKFGDIDEPEIREYHSWDDWYGDQTHDGWCE